MDLHHLSDKLHTGLDEIRDRTADVVGGDGGSVFREFGRLSKQLSGVEKHLASRIDDLEDDQTDLLEDLLGHGKRTTWPRKLFWLGLGVGVGYGIAYLTDPDRGQDRRAQLGQELSARTDEVRGQVTAQAEQLKHKAEERVADLRDDAEARATQAIDAAAKQADHLRGEVEQSLQQAKGAAIETAKDAMPDRPTDDQNLLEARIKSEVFGHRDDVQDVVIKVDGPGQVALKGTVPTPHNERELLAAVAEVDGVTDVRSELSVRSI
jgi:gas vesicle protein